MQHDRWTQDRARQWYRLRPWPVGCNFIPSSAINQLEMWQGDTFDPEIIDRELGWAEGLGFNTTRVYLHDLLWEADADHFVKRIVQYLEIAAAHHIQTLFVIFDDCWNRNPCLGVQPRPVPGVHNSGWVQSPGDDIVRDPSAWARLERYVRGLISTLGRDDRILGWDLYNEPGNRELDSVSLPLLQRVFEWARREDPGQPLMSGVWSDNQEIRNFQLQASDVLSFHNYEGLDSLRRQIEQFKTYDRPLICTEYMARTQQSRFETHLPVFREEGVGCINWGLVRGKTQTIFPWNSEEGSPEPDIWFHDILNTDGTAYNPDEVDSIRRGTKGGSTYTAAN